MWAPASPTPHTVPTPQHTRPQASATPQSVATVPRTGDTSKGKVATIIGITLAMFLGIFLMTQLVAGGARDNVWDSAVSKVVGGTVVKVQGDKAISFNSDPKRDCDLDDFPSYTRSGIQTIDRPAYEACESSADLDFSISVTQTNMYLTTFVTEIGLPESFLDELSRVRGLDGTQTREYANTKVGPVKVTYKYDGSNGIYVLIERK